MVYGRYVTGPKQKKKQEKEKIHTFFFFFNHDGLLFSLLQLPHNCLQSKKTSHIHIFSLNFYSFSSHKRWLVKKKIKKKCDKKTAYRRLYADSDCLNFSFFFRSVLKLNKCQVCILDQKSLALYAAFRIMWSSCIFHFSSFDVE